MSASFHPRRHLPLGHPFCALFHEQDLHRGEDDLEVLEQAGPGDVHQIQQQFVVGGGVVLAVDLSVAGEAAFGLEPQVPFGHFFGVLSGNFGAFGSGPYDGHIPFQDVQQLGQFVEADSPDEPAHPGDPGIVFAGAEPGHTIFFGIHAHAAEFQDGEDFSVFGKPFLAVEDVSPVGDFDGHGHGGHNGGKEHQCHQGQDDVVKAFEEQEFGTGVVPLHSHHGQVEQVDFFGAVHDHIPDPGDHIGPNLMGHTVFGDQIPVMAVKAAAEHHFGLSDSLGKVFHAFVHGDHGLDIEVEIHAVLLHQLVHVLALAHDHHGLFGRKHPEIPLVDCHGPQGDQEELEQKGGQKGEEADIVPIDQEGDEVQDAVADQRCQSLAVHQLIDPADGHAVAVVQMGGKVVEQPEQEHHDQVPCIVEGMDDMGFIEMLPAEPECPGDQQDVQSIQEFLQYFVVHGCLHHTPVHRDLLVVNLPTLCRFNGSVVLLFLFGMLHMVFIVIIVIVIAVPVAFVLLGNSV